VFVWIGGKWKPLSEYSLNRILKKSAKRGWVEQEITAHLFRHTLATHLAMAWWSPVAIQKKMRHSDLKTTSIYTHVFPKVMLEMTKSIGANLITV
jgi:site-specific recombinase XerD